MTKADLEQACIGWFRELGWSHARGEAISPGGARPERKLYQDVILAPRLRDALSRLNPDLPAEARNEAANHLLQYVGKPLVDANHELYTWLRDGIPVEPDKDGGRRDRCAHVLDFDDPDSNDWLLVSQFAVKGDSTHRLDLVVFVNGIPLSVIVLEDPTTTERDVTAAFEDVQAYMLVADRLFQPNLCCVISNGTVARMGSITADEERFMPWRAGTRIEQPEQHLELEVLVRGLFARETLLDYLRYFVTFRNSSSKPTKLIAGYHQYHGVHKAVQRTLEAATQGDDGRKGGVVWFTPGSGKSLIALFYVCLLREHPELENPTFVIVTDDNGPHRGLFETFAACRTPLRTEPGQATEATELKDMLRNGATGGVLFAPIRMFRPDEPGKPIEVLCKRSNVIVICDDAHHTQYAFKGARTSKAGRTGHNLAKHMREALPNAVFLALTGSPIAKDDKDAQAIFGEYVDTYDVLSSRRDGTTVPVYYEDRIIDIAVDLDELETLGEELDTLLKSEDDAQRSRAASCLARLKSIALADGRVERLAGDLIAHWDRRFEVMGGKAVIVAMSRPAAVALYDEIIKLRPSWEGDDLDTGLIKVAMGRHASDPPDMHWHATAPSEKKHLRERLKDPDDSLEILIVEESGLTGFNAPCVHTLYVDKPMGGAGVLQSMGSVNGVWKGKPGGLVVDYIGIGEALRTASAEYLRVAGAKRGRPVLCLDEAGKQLKDTVDTVRALFHAVDLSGLGDPEIARDLVPKAMDHILQVDPGDDPDRHEGVRRFIDLTTRASKAHALAATHEVALSQGEEIAFYQTVLAGLINCTRSGRKMSRSQREGAVRARGQTRDTLVLLKGLGNFYATLGVDRIGNLSVEDETQLTEIAKLPWRHLAAEMLQQVIDDELGWRSVTNAVQGPRFRKKLAEAIVTCRTRGVTTARGIEQLLQLANEIDQARPPEDMNDEEYCFYEALRENASATRELGEPIVRSLAAELTHKLRASATIDWHVREDRRAGMRLLVDVLLTRYRYPPNAKPDAVDKILEQAELNAIMWGIEYP